MDGFPDDFQIHFEITMREGIAHFIGEAPRNFRVLFCEVGVVFYNVVASFTNYLEITDRGILSFLIDEKVELG